MLCAAQVCDARLWNVSIIFVRQPIRSPKNKGAGLRRPLSSRRRESFLRGAIDRPFPQNLGCAFFRDFDHARQALFRAFLDATVEAAIRILAAAEDIVGTVEAEVGG